MAKAKVGTGNNVAHSDQKLTGVTVVPTASVDDLRDGFTPKLWSRLAKDNQDTDPRVSDGKALWPGRVKSRSIEPDRSPLKTVKQSGDKGAWNGGVSKDV